HGAPAVAGALARRSEAGVIGRGAGAAAAMRSEGVGEIAHRGFDAGGAFEEIAGDAFRPGGRRQDLADAQGAVRRASAAIVSALDLDDRKSERDRHAVALGGGADELDQGGRGALAAKRAARRGLFGGGPALLLRRRGGGLNLRGLGQIHGDAALVVSP